MSPRPNELMLGDNASVLADYDAIRIGMNLDRTPTALAATEYLLLSKRTRQVFETRRRHRVEIIEPASIGDQLRPFCLKHLPDRLLGRLPDGDAPWRR